MASASQAPARFYRPELDVLRFFAFLSVFLFHSLNLEALDHRLHSPRLALLLAALQRMLGFGLCLFFFLSSYLITSLLTRERVRTGTIALGKFYMRRILRIWPLYVLFLCSMFLLGKSWALASFTPGRLFAFLFLAGNWFCIRYGLGTAVIAPLWSISVEEQFYAVWPLLARTLSVRRLLISCVLLAMGSLAAIWELATRQVILENIWFNSFAQALFLAGGGILALAGGARQHRKSGYDAVLLTGTGLLLWLVGSLCSPLNIQAPVAAARITLCYALVAAGCAVILRGFLSLPEAWVAVRLVALGRISYGLYVFHTLMINAVAMATGPYLKKLHLHGAAVALALLLDIALAGMSYRFLEGPFLRLKQRFEPGPAASAA